LSTALTLQISTAEFAESLIHTLCVLCGDYPKDIAAGKDDLTRRTRTKKASGKE
jgi:hypothetical protein